MLAASKMDWTPSQRGSAALQVHLLGLTDLDAVLQLQEQIVGELAERRDTQGVLLLCEHANGVTIGREGSLADVHVDRTELESHGVPVRWLRRGGATWVHHPGQLVAYLLLPLQRLQRTAPDHLSRLALALRNVAAEQRILLAGQMPLTELIGRGGSIGFAGASVSDGVSRFGGCLNVSVPRPALKMVSWGPGVRPTSLSAERMRPICMASVREAWIRHLAATCGYSRYHVITGHPRLRRTTRRMYVCHEA